MITSSDDIPAIPATVVMPIISQTEDDTSVPGVQVEYSPDDADAFGAFEEDALSEVDAWASNVDLEKTIS